ncbi:hypothetical protein R3P38DRAFT_2808331 [Favolaschia claudopus]|uniref:Uncharacterized protein n=1 Tax=Favolaschia claudopus TaxID=2862362 RepID=A0AAV9ZFV0_9AGAR
MNRPSTRQSRRLHGQPASPPQPLPQRRSTPHTRILQDDINSPELHTESNAAVDVAQNDLAAIQEEQGNISMDSPNIHSPRARYPVSRTASFGSSSLGFPLGLESPASPALEASQQTHSPQLSEQFPPVNTENRLVALPSRIGNGSLANLRERERQRRTPALPLFIPFPDTPSPATRLDAAIYLGLPLGNPSQRGFLELVTIATAAPSLSDLLGALSGHGSTAAAVLNRIYGELDQIEYHIACSQRLVEVHDLSYSMLQNGYFEQGSLRAHFSSSMVVVPVAGHTPTSREIFRLRNIDEAIPFFVYIFPSNPIASTTGTTPASRASGSSRPASRSMSRTPNFLPTLPLQRSLANLAVVCVALDTHFLQEGHQLAALMEDSDSRPRFGVAYIQIRQVIILEGILSRPGNLIPTPTTDFPPSESVPLWGRLKPHTYRNYKTFAKDARGTLIHLRDRKNSGVTAISPVEQRKEDELRRFLAVCFAPTLATSDVVESLNQAGGSGTAILITAAVKAVRGRLETYQSGARPFREAPVTVLSSTYNV